MVCDPVYRLVSRLLGFELRPNESTYRVFSRRLVNSIIQIRSKNRYLSYLNASIGLRQSSIWYESNLAERKESAIRNMCRQLNTVSNILVSNSAVPLRFAGIMGVLASTGNLLYLIYILIVTLVKSRIAEGWLTLSLTSTTMFLFLFVILTVMAGYVARILDESKEQPLYFVESETNSSVSSTGQQRLNVIQERLSHSATNGASER
jgi:dolichol-phosphate mannosyltransferase